MAAARSAKRRRAEEIEQDQEDEEEEEEEEEAEESESESGDGSSSSSESMDLQVDQDGRVCTTEGLLTGSMMFNPPMRVFDDFLAPESVGLLKECCERCFKVKPSKGRYSSGKTFWTDSNQAPRCELEVLALAILRKHCPKPAGPAGVEWWTLCMDSDADVAWHWDRDYVLEDSGVNIHPMLATVTYLSNSSASTVALDVVSPPSRDGGPDSLVSIPTGGRAASCVVVPPVPGRHFVFDGRFLHGAPPAPETKKGVKRVTFLANIWVGHKPANASALLPELQVWSTPGESKGRIKSPVNKAPLVITPVEVTTTGPTVKSILEGGIFSVALPVSRSASGSRDGSSGKPDVVTSLATVGWTRKTLKKRKKRKTVA